MIQENAWGCVRIMWSCLCEFVSIECHQYRERLEHWDIVNGIMDEVKNCSILLQLCAICHMRNWSFNHCDPKPCGPISNFTAIPVSPVWRVYCGRVAPVVGAVWLLRCVWWYALRQLYSEGLMVMAYSTVPYVGRVTFPDFQESTWYLSGTYRLLQALLLEIFRGDTEQFKCLVSLHLRLIWAMIGSERSNWIGKKSSTTF